MSGSQKRSDIWNYFTITTKDKAKCTLCNTVYSYKGGTTSNLKKHLSSKHPTIIVNAPRSRITMSSAQQATSNEDKYLFL